MKTIDLLKFVKAQLIHMEVLLQDIDQATSNGAETIHKYPIHSNTGALFLLDLAIQEDKQATEINQELRARLESLVIEFDDEYVIGSYRHTIMQEAKQILNKKI